MDRDARIGGNQLAQAAEEIEAGMDRMQNEGGGVVEQSDPAGTPMLRNNLAQYAYMGQIPDGFYQQEEKLDRLLDGQSRQRIH